MAPYEPSPVSLRRDKRTDEAAIPLIRVRFLLVAGNKGFGSEMEAG
jgi:hypothetical protein